MEDRVSQAPSSSTTGGWRTKMPWPSGAYQADANVEVAPLGQVRLLRTCSAQKMTSKFIGLEHFIAFLNRWGFTFRRVCDSRCWLDGGRH
ncbi:hypothetical protein CHELA17_40346 [Chelatococcus asaccharovorans]|nr:hypothetical protein CHELA17_40346 [Chelatococcus asaccharovorans]